MNSTKLHTTSKAVVVLGLIGVMLLLTPLGLSQVPPGRFSVFGPRFGVRPPRPPLSINSRGGRNLPFVDMGVLDDLVGPITVAAPFPVLQGTVYGESGDPAPGIVVVIEAEDANRTYRVTTDKAGRFNYSGLPAGNYLLEVVYKGESGLSRQVPLVNGRLSVSNFDLQYFVATGKAGIDLGELKRRLKSRSDAPNELPNVSHELLKTYDEAWAAASRGDFETALKLMKELVEKAPGEAAFWRRLGECHLELTHYSDAAVAFRKASELNPTVADYPGLLALSLLFIGNLDEAAQYTEKAAALDKAVGAEAYYNLGLALTDAGEVARAEAVFTRATELNDLLPGAFFQLGLTLLSTHPNNLVDAKKPLERFIKLAPGTDDASVAEHLIVEIDTAGRKPE